MNAVLTMSNFAFQLLSFQHVSRILKPDGLGRVSFAGAVVAYFMMISQLGIPTYGIRACARVRNNRDELSKVAHELLFLGLITCVIAYAFFFATLASISRLRSDKTVLLIVSANILLNTIGFEWLYKALEQYTYIAVRSILFKAIALLLTFIFIRDESDYLIYAVITVCASSASSVVNFIKVGEFISVRRLRNYSIFRHVKTVLVFFSMSVATIIYTNLDELMLGLMTTNTDVGLYDAAVKIRKILLSIVTAVGAVILPRVSYYIENNMKEELNAVWNKAMSFVLMTSIPLTLFFFIFAHESINFLSGTLYNGAVKPMQIIMPTVFLVGVSNITGIQVLIPLGKEKIVLISEVLGAIADVILNLILIPKYGAAGAAIGTLIAEMIVLGFQLSMIKEYNRVLFRNANMFSYAIGALISCILVVWIKYIHASAFLTLMLAGTVYAVSYIVYLLVIKNKLMIESIRGLMNTFKEGRK